MVRHCLALDLKNDAVLIDEYEHYHQHVWKEIIESITSAGIQVLDIYRTGNRLFMIIEAEEGIPVIVDRNATQNEIILQELQQAGRQAIAIQGELTNEADCKAIIDKTIATYGRIDGLVNNAGVNDGVSLEHGTVEGFNR